jgi:predicted nuclease of predicted toxin-antitoxin system
MQFLLDMGLSVRVTEWLRTQGHDAVHLREEGLQTLEDDEIFAKAAAEGRVVLTFDLDFGEIAAVSGSRIVSIIILRLNSARAEYVIKRLSAVLPMVGPALVAGSIVTIEDSRHRIRSLPIQP